MWQVIQSGHRERKSSIDWTELESSYGMELHSLLKPAGKVDTGHLLPDVVTEALEAREEGRGERTPEQHDH